jgi:hypothetical protein
MIPYKFEETEDHFIIWDGEEIFVQVHKRIGLLRDLKTLFVRKLNKSDGAGPLFDTIVNITKEPEENERSL